MKSRAAVAARRLAHQEWLRESSTPSSPQPEGANMPHTAQLDASIREHYTPIILWDFGLAD